MFLVLEVTIGFKKRDENGEEEEELMEAESEIQEFESGNKIKWTSQDHKFLRALKIAVDEEQ